MTQAFHPAAAAAALAVCSACHAAARNAAAACCCLPCTSSRCYQCCRQQPLQPLPLPPIANAAATTTSTKAAAASQKRAHKTRAHLDSMSVPASIVSRLSTCRDQLRDLCYERIQSELLSEVATGSQRGGGPTDESADSLFRCLSEAHFSSFATKDAGGNAEPSHSFSVEVLPGSNEICAVCEADADAMAAHFSVGMAVRLDHSSKSFYIKSIHQDNCHPPLLLSQFSQGDRSLSFSPSNPNVTAGCPISGPGIAPDTTIRSSVPDYTSGTQTLELSNATVSAGGGPHARSPLFPLQPFPADSFTVTLNRPHPNCHIPAIAAGFGVCGPGMAPGAVVAKSERNAATGSQTLTLTIATNAAGGGDFYTFPTVPFVVRAFQNGSKTIELHPPHLNVTAGCYIQGHGIVRRTVVTNSTIDASGRQTLSLSAPTSLLSVIINPFIRGSQTLQLNSPHPEVFAGCFITGPGIAPNTAVLSAVQQQLLTLTLSAPTAGDGGGAFNSYTFSGGGAYSFFLGDSSSRCQFVHRGTEITLTPPHPTVAVGCLIEVSDDVQPPFPPAVVCNATIVGNTQTLTLSAASTLATRLEGNQYTFSVPFSNALLRVVSNQYSFSSRLQLEPFSAQQFDVVAVVNSRISPGHVIEGPGIPPTVVRKATIDGRGKQVLTLSGKTDAGGGGHYHYSAKRFSFTVSKSATGDEVPPEELAVSPPSLRRKAEVTFRIAPATMRLLIRDALASPQLFCSELSLCPSPSIPGQMQLRNSRLFDGKWQAEYLTLDDLLQSHRVLLQPPPPLPLLTSNALVPQLKPSVYLFDIDTAQDHHSLPLLDPLHNAARRSALQHGAVLPGTKVVFTRTVSPHIQLGVAYDVHSVAATNANQSLSFCVSIFDKRQTGLIDPNRFPMIQQAGAREQPKIIRSELARHFRHGMPVRFSHSCNATVPPIVAHRLYRLSSQGLTDPNQEFRVEDSTGLVVDFQDQFQTLNHLFASIGSFQFDAEPYMYRPVVSPPLEPIVAATPTLLPVLESAYNQLVPGMPITFKTSVPGTTPPVQRDATYFVDNLSSPPEHSFSIVDDGGIPVDFSRFLAGNASNDANLSDILAMDQFFFSEQFMAGKVLDHVHETGVLLKPFQAASPTRVVLETENSNIVVGCTLQGPNGSRSHAIDAKITAIQTVLTVLRTIGPVDPSTRYISIEVELAVLPFKQRADSIVLSSPNAMVVPGSVVCGTSFSVGTKVIRKHGNTLHLSCPALAGSQSTKFSFKTPRIFVETVDGITLSTTNRHLVFSDIDRYHFLLFNDTPGHAGTVFRDCMLGRDFTVETHLTLSEAITAAVLPNATNVYTCIKECHEMLADPYDTCLIRSPFAPRLRTGMPIKFKPEITSVRPDIQHRDTHHIGRVTGEAFSVTCGGKELDFFSFSIVCKSVGRFIDSFGTPGMWTASPGGMQGLNRGALIRVPGLLSRQGDCYVVLDVSEATNEFSIGHKMGDPPIFPGSEIFEFAVVDTLSYMGSAQAKWHSGVLDVCAFAHTFQKNVVFRSTQLGATVLKIFPARNSGDVDHDILHCERDTFSLVKPLMKGPMEPEPYRQTKTELVSHMSQYHHMQIHMSFMERRFRCLNLTCSHLQDHLGIVAAKAFHDPLLWNLSSQERFFVVSSMAVAFKSDSLVAIYNAVLNHRREEMRLLVRNRIVRAARDRFRDASCISPPIRVYGIEGGNIIVYKPIPCPDIRRNLRLMFETMPEAGSFVCSTTFPMTDASHHRLGLSRKNVSHQTLEVVNVAADLRGLGAGSMLHMLPKTKRSVCVASSLPCSRVIGLRIIAGEEWWEMESCHGLRVDMKVRFYGWQLNNRHKHAWNPCAKFYVKAIKKADDEIGYDCFSIKVRRDDSNSFSVLENLLLSPRDPKRVVFDTKPKDRFIVIPRPNRQPWIKNKESSRIGVTTTAHLAEALPEPFVIPVPLPAFVNRILKARFQSIILVAPKKHRLQFSFDETEEPPFLVGQIVLLKGFKPDYLNSQVTITECTSDSLAFIFEHDVVIKQVELDDDDRQKDRKIIFIGADEVLASSYFTCHRMLGLEREHLRLQGRAGSAKRVSDAIHDDKGSARVGGGVASGSFASTFLSVLRSSAPPQHVFDAFHHQSAFTQALNAVLGNGHDLVAGASTVDAALTAVRRTLEQNPRAFEEACAAARTAAAQEVKKLSSEAQAAMANAKLARDQYLELKGKAEFQIQLSEQYSVAKSNCTHAFDKALKCHATRFNRRIDEISAHGLRSNAEPAAHLLARIDAQNDTFDSVSAAAGFEAAVAAAFSTAFSGYSCSLRSSLAAPGNFTSTKQALLDDLSYRSRLVLSLLTHPRMTASDIKSIWLQEAGASDAAMSFLRDATASTAAITLVQDRPSAATASMQLVAGDGDRVLRIIALSDASADAAEIQRGNRIGLDMRGKLRVLCDTVSNAAQFLTSTGGSIVHGHISSSTLRRPCDTPTHLFPVSFEGVFAIFASSDPPIRIPPIRIDPPISTDFVGPHSSGFLYDTGTNTPKSHSESQARAMETHLPGPCHFVGFVFFEVERHASQVDCFCIKKQSHKDLRISGLTHVIDTSEACLFVEDPIFNPPNSVRWISVVSNASTLESLFKLNDRVPDGIRYCGFRANAQCCVTKVTLSAAFNIVVEIDAECVLRMFPKVGFLVWNPNRVGESILNIDVEASRSDAAPFKQRAGNHWETEFDVQALAAACYQLACGGSAPFSPSPRDFGGNRLPDIRNWIRSQDELRADLQLYPYQLEPLNVCVHAFFAEFARVVCTIIFQFHSLVSSSLL